MKNAQNPALQREGLSARFPFLEPAILSEALLKPRTSRENCFCNFLGDGKSADFSHSPWISAEQRVQVIQVIY